MKNRLTAWLLACCMVLTMTAYFVLPATAATAKTEISTAKEFLALATGDLSGDYIQTADIDLTGWACTPIGTLAAPFTGTYDGNGYTISGFALNSAASYQGLFGVNSGTIRNVTLDDSCSIAGSSYVGAIAGKNTGTIEGCISYASVTHKAASESGASFKILSQNLSSWGDNEFAAIGSYTTSRRPSMLSRIKTADPDILLLQEVTYYTRTFTSDTGEKNTVAAWNTYLTSNLTAYTYVGQYRSESDKEGVTVAYKTSRFNKINQGIFWLSTNPDGSISSQTPAWGAECVRTAQWVILQDKTTGQQFAVYSIHLDHVSAEAREQGGKLIAERIDALKKQYPDAIFILGGDLNENPTAPGYGYIDSALGGNFDDSRYISETITNDIATSMNVDTLAINTNRRAAIDHIFLDIDQAEVEHFEILSDTYNNIAPSDHCGVLAQVEPLANNYVGGAVGYNGGTLSRIIAAGTFDGGTAEGSGSFLGANSNKGNVKDCHSTDGDASGLIGTAATVSALPEIVNLHLAHGLGNAFTVEDGKYALIDGCSEGTLAKVVVNGEIRYEFAGTIIDVETTGAAGEIVFVNGEVFEGAAVAVPEEGITVSVATPVSNVTKAASSGDYTISNITEWMYLYNRLSYFQNRNITIHLLCDINLSVAAASSFGGFNNPCFSFDGHGHTVSHFGTAAAPKTRALFRVNGGGQYGMGYIKDLTMKNCHVSAAFSAILYSVQCANAGYENLPRDLSISGITIDSCSLTATGEACGMILTRYGVAGRDYAVNIKGCVVKNSTLDAGEYAHMGFIVGKMRSGGEIGTATFNISDCCISGNTLKNGGYGAGLVCGSSEGKNTANFSNIGIFNNTLTATKAAYICSDFGGSGTTVNMDQLLIGGNTMSGEGTYLVAGSSVSNTAAGTLGKLYIDQNVTAIAEGQTIAYTTDAANLQSGKAGYDLNKTLTDPAIFWAKDGSYYKAADRDGQVRIVTVRNGSATTSQYANGGDTLALSAPAIGSYRVTEGNGSVSGTTLTIGTDADTVVSACAPVTTVTSAVSSGDYTVSSISDWMVLFNHLDRFKNRNITIHLLSDIDLSDPAAASFTCFVDPTFSFNGHGHTISNWGTTASRKAQRGMFYADTGAGGMNYIKNVDFSNCHTGGMGSNEAIVYSVSHGNGGLSGLPTTLTLENIHIDGCSIASTGESAAMLLSRYGVSGSGFTVNITNCSVTDCTMTAGSGAHKAMLVGKPRSAGTATGTYNITDCYVANNTITGAVQGTGAVFGTAEDGTTAVNLNNVGVVDNTITTSNDGAYIGFSDSGKVTLNNMILDGNTVSASTKYLVAVHNGSASVTLGTIYSDVSELTSAVEGNTALTHTAAASKVASGEAAFLLNQTIGDAAIYWGNTEGKTVCTDKDHQSTRISLRLADGLEVKSLYANGGSTVSLSVDQDPNAAFEGCGEARVIENVLNVPLGGGTVTVKVISEDPNAFLPDYGDPVTTVTGIVSKGIFTIANVEEWMYVYEHMDYFAGTDITLILTADLDLSAERAAAFEGFESASFSLDGDGHTLKNWTVLESSTNAGNALFREYLGDSIRNLTLDGFKVGGGYGRGLLVGNYSGTNSLRILNVHVKNCVLDATAAGYQMGVFLARPANNAVNNALISIKNCSVVNTALENSCASSVNNAGLIIGSAYKDFQYKLTNIYVEGCEYNVEAGAAGMAVGAVEHSGTTMVMDHVGLFNCSLTSSSTNQYPAIFAGEMLGGATLTYKNCMAADISAAGKKNLSMVKHSADEVIVTAENCYTDFPARMIQTTDNVDGITLEYEGLLEGVTKADPAVFKDGSVAWAVNQTSGKAGWLVGQSTDGSYPTPIAAEGYAAPFKITFGAEGSFYTNGAGTLCSDAYETLNTDAGVWHFGAERVTEETVFTADSALSLTAHNYDRTKATAIGSKHHTVSCANGCGATVTEECQFSEWTHKTENGEHIHVMSCPCGNFFQGDCRFEIVSKGGTHSVECTTCGYEKEWNTCSNTLTHIEGTDTHHRVCATCGYTTEPVSCTMSSGTVKEASLGKEGSITKSCIRGCGNRHVEILAAIGDVNSDHEVGLADAVTLLRVLSGKLNSERIDKSAANVHTADGYTDNDGLSTADVMAILQYLLGEYAP